MDIRETAARQRRAERLCALGPRAIDELLKDIAKATGRGPCVEHVADQYAERLSPELLRAVGADQFPPLPIREVS